LGIDKRHIDALPSTQSATSVKIPHRPRSFLIHQLSPMERGLWTSFMPSVQLPPHTGSGAVMRRDSSVDFGVIYILYVYLTSFIPFSFFTVSFPYAFFLTYLLPYWFTFCLINLLLPEQTRSVSRPEVFGSDQTWLYFLSSFYVVVCFAVDACLLLLCLFQSFSVLSREIGWEERLRNDLFNVGWDVKP